MQQRQNPCAHYLPITDQLLWSHSSPLQIHLVLVAYSSTISLWDAQAGPRATSPSGQSIKFTPQQVMVVDSGRQIFCRKQGLLDVRISLLDLCYLHHLNTWTINFQVHFETTKKGVPCITGKEAYCLSQTAQNHANLV